MFTNQNACTVYEKTMVNRAPAYIRHVITSVYWELTRGESRQGTNRNPQDGALCIIPKKSLTDYVPQTDDRIVCGICEAASPPQDAMTVRQIRDFRYGSPAVQHLEVSAV